MEQSEVSVRFVGVSDEKLQTVTDFLGKDEWKEKTRYTLATDPDRSTYNSYMAAAGQNGIPTALAVLGPFVYVSTTSETLGFTGRGEGIAAQAVCLLVPA